MHKIIDEIEFRLFDVINNGFISEKDMRNIFTNVREQYSDLHFVKCDVSEAVHLNGAHKLQYELVHKPVVAGSVKLKIYCASGDLLYLGFCRDGGISEYNGIQAELYNNTIHCSFPSTFQEDGMMIVACYEYYKFLENASDE